METTHTRKMELLLVCTLLCIGVFSAQFAVSFSQGPNNRNVSVDTTVNITGSGPEIFAVFATDPITLSANGVVTVTCDVFIQDFNGFGDLDTVNATFFSTDATLSSVENNNTHYTNTSCAPIAGQQSGSLANYTCTFGVLYHAIPGSWNCTAEVNDSINLVGRGSNVTTINQLLALNVTTLIDYGQLAIGEFSDNQTANVTNVGNVNINVSVLGYGQDPGDNLSFVCEQNNLTVDLQHFSADASDDYASKTTLSGIFQQIPQLTVNKTDNGTNFVNTTYWELFLDPAQNAFGVCNGTVVFQAEAAA